jgi:CubicO group peptidase (beta-lactamase class C family)
LKVLFEPGTKFSYSGEGFLYLQRVIEHITGEPFNAFVKRTLFAPLGIAEASYEWQDAYQKNCAAAHDAQGKVVTNRPLYHKANTAGSLYCSPTEYALFVTEILRQDRSAAESLSEQSLRAMFTRTSKVEGKTPVTRRGGPPATPTHYGLGWSIDAMASGDRISHSGAHDHGFYCFCEFDPQHGSGIVIMTNAVGGKVLWRRLIASISDP